MTNEEKYKLLDAVIKASRDNIMGGKYRKAYKAGVLNAYNKLVEAINELNPNYNGVKSELEQTRWIPVSERLPEDEDYDEMFTVTIQCEHYDGWEDYVTGYAEWTPNGWDIQSCYIGQIKVTAWMPLPEPYKAESED